MFESDAIKLAIAGGVLLMSAVSALRSGRSPSTPAARSVEIAPLGEEPPKATVERAHPEPRIAGRPRILTGEPAAPEQRKPASRRAIKLVAGITTLAVAGAVGLLALVRALIAMFRRIGG